jgi:phosphoribosylanthranilate isomerase
MLAQYSYFFNFLYKIRPVKGGLLKRRTASVPRVKICCISSIREAKFAIECGAHAIGLVANMPSGPGVISEDLIAEIARYAPPAVTSVLLTSHKSIEDIIEQHHNCRTNAIQICDDLITGNHDNLRVALPGISLLQVIHISGTESIRKAKDIAPYVDAILLDSGNKSEGKIELGGTGRPHDWSVSAQICQQVDIPIFLAGGLNPDNVIAAINQVQPFAVDVCSGVRTNNQLDKEKVSAFIQNVNSV